MQIGGGEYNIKEIPEVEWGWVGVGQTNWMIGLGDWCY